MYNETTINFSAIIGGILSLLLIITFFVIAARLKKIMQSTILTAKILRADAIIKGTVKSVICPDCKTVNNVFDDDPRPVHCKKNNCYRNLSTTFPELDNRQTDKTDKL
jgi:phage FluMu protein Com